MARGVLVFSLPVPMADCGRGAAGTHHAAAGHRAPPPRARAWPAKARPRRQAGAATAWSDARRRGCNLLRASKTRKGPIRLARAGMRARDAVPACWPRELLCPLGVRLRRLRCFGLWRSLPRRRTACDARRGVVVAGYFRPASDRQELATEAAKQISRPARCARPVRDLRRSRSQSRCCGYRVAVELGLRS